MGGSIAVIVRESDGKEHRMCRWTNPTPDIINNIDFIQKDESYMRDGYLKTWYGMVQEYADHVSGKKKLPEITMVDVYVPSGGKIVPIEYGILVIDYKTRTLLHMQGYTSYGEKDAAGIALDAMEAEAKGKYAIENMKNLKRLFDEKCIKSTTMYDETKVPPLIEEPFSEPNFDSFLKKCNSRWEDRKKKHAHLVSVELNMAPWNIRRFDEDSKGAVGIRQAILDLGFTLTEEEEKEWKEWIDVR